MACPSPLIPDRLHWHVDDPVYTDCDFLDEHLLYRLGNPIEFPSSITGFSCNWSFLISEEDVLATQDPVKHEDYKYALVADIRNFRLKEEKEVDNSHLGWHVLTCFFEHVPTECVYAHCEVNISHEIFEDKDETTSLVEYRYTGEDAWKKTILSSNSQWFRQFRLDYKTEMYKTFCYPLPNEANVS